MKFCTNIHNGKNFDMMEPINEIYRVVQTATTNKLVPLEADFLFDEFYPSVIRGSVPSSACVLFTSSDEELASEFADVICRGNSELDRDEITIISEKTTSCDVPLPFDPERVRFIDARPGHAVSNLEYLYYPLEIEPVSAMLEKVASIVVLLRVDQPDIRSSLRRLLRKIKSYVYKTRYIICGNVECKTNLSVLLWSLAGCLHSPEIPPMYFISDLRSTSDERDRFFGDISELPMRLLLVELNCMLRQARLSRAHALLLSHIKSNLPAFGRQSKQERICEDLHNFIASVSSKSKLPVSDFPAPDYIREKIANFDFSRIKKLKESNLALVTEFIEVDFPRIKNLFPHSWEFKLHRPINETHPTVLTPSIDSYLTEFEALEPEQGLVTGQALKDHLSRISNLSSSQLHKIWRLADQDCDGKLSLKEYAVCRELIRMTVNGVPLPVSFQLS